MNPGAELAHITMGIDHLYRRHTKGAGFLDDEGLVPVSLAQIEPIHYEQWDDADQALIDLAQRLPAETDDLRRAYLVEMIDSLRALLSNWSGHGMSYADQVQRCLRVPGQPIADKILQSYHHTIGDCLAEMGASRGDLTEDLRQWEKETRVPDADVLPILRQLLYAARERTETNMFPIPDGMLEPVGVYGVPFAAYCDYPGRQLILNLDYDYTPVALKHLACHEGFPGHFVHLARREALVRQGQMPLDAALVVTSSASSALFEGIAENGIAFLDWIEGPADRLGLAVNRLRSAARINAAWLIHSEGRTPDAACDYLMATCLQTRTWAESRLAFLTHPLRAPFIFAYWYGDMAVERVWQRVPPARRAEFWHYLYAHMHTPTTLETFWQ